MEDLRNFDGSSAKVRKRLKSEAKSKIELHTDTLPRIHNLEEIANYVALVSEFGETSFQEMGRAGPQGLGHIRHAAKILRLLDSNNNTTRKSKDFHKRALREQLALISVAIEKSPFTQLWMQWSGVDNFLNLNPDCAKEFLKEKSGGVKESTMKQRISTLKSIVRKAQNFHPSTIDNTDFLLRPLNLMRRTEFKRDLIFENGKAEQVISRLSKDSKFIRVASGYLSIEGYDLLARNLKSAQIRMIIGENDRGGRRDLQSPSDKFKESVEAGPNLDWKRKSLKRLHNELLWGSTRVVDAQARHHKDFHPKVYIFDGSAVLHGSFNTSISGFRNNIENGSIEVEYNDVEYFVERFDPLFLESVPIETDLSEIIEESWVMDDIEEVDSGIAFLRILLELYGSDVDFSDNTNYSMADYQRYTCNKSVSDIVDYGGSLLVAPTGTGKSIIGSFVALTLLKQNVIDRVIIISPTQGIEKAWKDYMRDFRIGPYLERISLFREQKGDSIREIERFTNSLCDRDLLILDECHSVMNDKSKGAQNLSKALGSPGNNSPKRLFMTATPMSKGLNDLNNLLEFVHPKSNAKKPLDVASLPGVSYLTHSLIACEFATEIDGSRAVKFDTWRHFANKYTLTINYESNHEEIFDIIENLNLISKKEIEIDEFQLRLFDGGAEFEHGISHELVRFTAARMAESSPASLRNFCQNRLNSNLENNYIDGWKLRADYERIIGILDSTERDQKSEELIERTRKLIENGRKVMVFTTFPSTAEYLRRLVTEAFPEINCETIIGDTPERQKSEILRRFAPVAHGMSKRKRKDDIHFLIATDSISEGVNLQDATLLVNYDLTWTPLKMIQRIGRLDRPTKDKRTFGVHNYFPGQDYFERIIGIWGRLKSREKNYQQMAGLSVVDDGLRDLDDISDEDMEHILKIYESDEVDIDAVLESYIPATNHLKRLAKATVPEIELAKSLPIGAIAVRDISDTRQQPGILVLCQDPEKQPHLVWHDLDGNTISTYHGVSRESILSKAECDIGQEGNHLPDWFDQIQEGGLQYLANALEINVNEITPIISIVNI